jgi:hypothetical protein
MSLFYFFEKYDPALGMHTNDECRYGDKEI